MYYRAFLPESDIVGAQEYKVSDGKNWSDTAGMFLSGNALYFASRSTGNLSRITFTGGKAVGAATPVSGPLIDGTDWRSRAMFLTGGQSSAPPPVASFTSSCQLLNCAFDSSASTAPGGQIASYAWNFGDGSTSTQANPSHSFAQAGSYGVTLTVKDNRGSTGSASATVTVSTTQSQSISFVAKASTTGNSRTYSVTIPASVKAGNGLLLLLAANSASTVGDPTGLTGWQRVDTIVQRGITSIVWQKVAGASDASKMVTIDLGDTHKATLHVLVYSGTNAAGPVAGYAVDSDNAVTDHTTPKASVTSTGSWALSYWADKSSSTTAWTAPAGQATRDVIYGTGSGRITALVTDSGGPVAVGTYGGLTASTDAASTAIRWTLVLRAGG
jgi:PKD repeat protein